MSEDSKVDLSSGVGSVQLAKGDSLYPEHHIIRYVPPKYIDGEDIDGGAFVARPSDDGSVSYNWVEYYLSPKERQLESIRSCARLKYASNGRLVELNVEKMLSKIEAMLPDFKTEVRYDPLDPCEPHPADPSHSIMVNIPEGDDPLAEAIGDLIRDSLLKAHAAKR